MLLRVEMFLLALVACAALAPAHAQDRGASSEHRWEAMNTCNKDAFTHYPDYTAEAAKQREVYVRKCLRDQRLPEWTGYGTQPASR